MDRLTLISTFKRLHELEIPIQEFPSHFQEDKKTVRELLRRRQEIREQAKSFQLEQKSKPEGQRLLITDLRATLSEEDALLLDDLQYRMRLDAQKRKEAEQVVNEKRPRPTENTATTVQSRYVPAKSITFRLKAKEPINKKMNIKQSHVPNAPPGYRFVDTIGDGDCLFYSVFYAWYPEQGTTNAQTPAASKTIREFIQEHVQEEDLFDTDELLRDIQLSIGWNQVEAQELTDALTSILADPSPANILEQYKKIIMFQSFWGANRELYILNKYGPEEGHPIICLYRKPGDNYEVTWTRGCIPIHYNGTNHYSILEKIPGAEAENLRDRYFNLLERRSTERDIITQKRGAIVNVLRDTFEQLGQSRNLGSKFITPIHESYASVADANSSAEVIYEKAKELGLTDDQAQRLKNAAKAKIQNLQGGKRKTRKNRKPKKRTTRKH